VVPLSILSDDDIIRWRREGKLSIEPFHEENLTPNGYDLTIAEVLVGGTSGKSSKGAQVPPLTSFAVSTEEVVALGPMVTGQIWIRTSWARRGVLASFGRVDAGFSGTLTLAAFNASPAHLKVEAGMTFAQMVFEELRTPARLPYPERSGHYQGQRGVTPPREGP
jgi:dCTP deaminase